jgi:hypothetical protein
MVKRREGQENRHNTRRPHSSTTGNDDATQQAADEDVAAAAAMTSKSKNGRPSGNVNVVIKTPDGSAVLNMNDAIMEQDTRAIASDGTIMLDQHIQIAFGMLLRQGQVFVEHNGTYIKLLSDGMRLRPSLQLFNFKNESSRIRLGAAEFRCKTPYFYLYYEFVNGERIITSATWNQEPLSVKSKEDFESQVRQVAPTSAAASGNDASARSEDVADNEEQTDEWQNDSSVPSTDKTPAQQGKATTTTTHATATTTPFALKPPPRAATGKLAATPQRARKSESVPWGDKEPAKQPKLGHVGDVSTVELVPQAEVRASVEASGKMAATAKADLARWGNKKPKKNPKLERVDEVSKTKMEPQDEGLAPGDAREESHMASDKKIPRTDASDKKRPPANAPRAAIVASLPQRETGKPSLARGTGIKVGVKEGFDFAKSDQDSSPGTPVDMIETIDLTNLESDSESEVVEDAGETLQLRTWLKQKLEILEANADLKLPFSIQELKLLCQAGTRALASDPLLLELDSPIAICGDIHGDFTSMRSAAEVGKAYAKVRIMSTLVFLQTVPLGNYWLTASSLAIVLTHFVYRDAFSLVTS